MNDTIGKMKSRVNRPPGSIPVASKPPTYAPLPTSTAIEQQDVRVKDINGTESQRLENIEERDTRTFSIALLEKLRLVIHHPLIG